MRTESLLPVEKAYTKTCRIIESITQEDFGLALRSFRQLVHEQNLRGTPNWNSTLLYRCARQTPQDMPRRLEHVIEPQAQVCSARSCAGLGSSREPSTRSGT